MPIHGEVYSIQHYVIKFVSYLQQVIDFLRGLRAPPPIKLIAPNITEILLKVALNTINLNQTKPVQIITKVVSSNPAHSEVFDTTLCDNVCQWHEAGRWFSPDTPVSSTNKTDRHDITEILLEVALNTITP